MKLVLSALGPSISEQLSANGLEHSEGKSIDVIERLAEAATLLYIHGVMTDSECTKVRARIVNELNLRPAMPQAGERQ